MGQDAAERVIERAVNILERIAEPCRQRRIVTRMLGVVEVPAQVADLMRIVENAEEQVPVLLLQQRFEQPAFARDVGDYAVAEAADVCCAAAAEVVDVHRIGAEARSQCVRFPRWPGSRPLVKVGIVSAPVGQLHPIEIRRGIGLGDVDHGGTQAIAAQRLPERQVIHDTGAQDLGPVRAGHQLVIEIAAVPARRDASIKGRPGCPCHARGWCSAGPQRPVEHHCQSRQSALCGPALDQVHIDGIEAKEDESCTAHSQNPPVICRAFWHRLLCALPEFVGA